MEGWMNLYYPEVFLGPQSSERLLRGQDSWEEVFFSDLPRFNSPTSSPGLTPQKIYHRIKYQYKIVDAGSDIYLPVILEGATPDLKEKTCIYKSFEAEDMVGKENYVPKWWWMGRDGFPHGRIRIKNVTQTKTKNPSICEVLGRLTSLGCCVKKNKYWKPAPSGPYFVGYSTIPISFLLPFHYVRDSAMDYGDESHDSQYVSKKRK